jgi:hypothetical protein
MATKSELTYQISQDRGSRQWHWEIRAEGYVIDRGDARTAMEARVEAIRRGLAGTQGAGNSSKHKSEGDSGATPSA